MKVDLPELENFYHIICTWDFYRDFNSEEDVTKHREEDEFFESVKESKEEDNNINNKINTSNKLEKVPIKFSNTEEYIRTFHNLFMIECKSQIGRSIQDEVKYKI
jgi:hypothetical protein